MNIVNRVAVVTGGSRGIGRGVALRLAKEGSDVAIICRSSLNLAEEVANEITKLGRRSLVVQADVGMSQDVSNAFKKIFEEYGRIDILVNNAAIVNFRALSKMSDEEWRKTLSVNLDGVFYCTRAALPSMMKNRYGRIICISSGSGIRGSAYLTHYSASKSGLFGLIKGLAKEVASYNITANAIIPGAIQTDQATGSASEKVLQEIGRRTPLRRLGKPEDIAGAVKFFTSDDAAWITGQVLTVDGGHYLTMDGEEIVTRGFQRRSRRR